MRRRTAGIGAINKDKRKAELLKDKGMRPLFSIYPQYDKADLDKSQKSRPKTPTASKAIS